MTSESLQPIANNTVTLLTNHLHIQWVSVKVNEVWNITKDAFERKKKRVDLLQTASIVSCYNAQVCCYVTKIYDFTTEAKIYSNNWALKLDKNRYLVFPNISGQYMKWK